MTLEDILNFNTDRGDLETMVDMLAHGELVLAKFEALDLDVPERLPLKLKAIKREIMQKQADRLQKRKVEIDLRLDSMKTPGEKKAELLREKKRIDAMLASVGE